MIELIASLAYGLRECVVVAQLIKKYSERVDGIDKRVSMNKGYFVGVGTRDDAQFRFLSQRTAFAFQTKVSEVTKIDVTYLSSELVFDLPTNLRISFPFRSRIYTQVNGGFEHG